MMRGSSNFRSARIAATLVSVLGWLCAIIGAVVAIGLVVLGALSGGPLVLRTTNMVAALPVLVFCVGGLIMVLAAALSRAAFDMADKSARTQ